MGKITEYPVVITPVISVLVQPNQLNSSAQKSSLTVMMHSKTFQVHSDDPNNVNDNIYLNSSVVVLSKKV